jgi:hypothetical protein
MENIFLSRRVFVKSENVLQECPISIGEPVLKNDGNYTARVKFSIIEKYNTDIVGVDNFHAIECAIEFINVIFRESDDPEFYDEDGNSIRNLKR